MVGEEKLKIQVTNDQGRTVVMLTGIIDEDAKFEALLQYRVPLIFNFRGVSAINSCGVRNWVNFIKTIADRQVYYVECPPLVVKQMNMIPSFVGHAQVFSVHVPYVCDNCDHEKLILLTSDQFKNAAQTLKCEKCGQTEMEFDGHPQQYFAFGK